jgi:CxxC motif-containing protein (DUF1111 family)
MSASHSIWGHRSVACLEILLAIGALAAPASSQARDDLALGKALFAREWRPNDPRSLHGDGLGPLYNETSCLACHFQGAPGGAGPASKNVELLSRGKSRIRKAADFAKVHPGLVHSKSVMLHRFGVDPAYGRWRLRLVGEDDFADRRNPPRTTIPQVHHGPMFKQNLLSQPVSKELPNGLIITERNPPALFGLGLIELVPTEALVDAARRQHPDFPEIEGRVSRLRDGRVGRHGWKAQVATLHEFVRTACAMELGLEVPARHQAPSPLDPEAKVKGLDLSFDECNALETYVRYLPTPTSRAGASSRDPGTAAALKEGRALFEKAGCAACHTPKLGDIDGIYSDLLIHEMGSELSEFDASYYGNDFGGEIDPLASPISSAAWRTPPLWGVADSAPYLHDGRAQTLEAAIAQHGGEADATTRRFLALSPEERLKVEAFLRSLPAPAPPAMKR